MAKKKLKVGDKLKLRVISTVDGEGKPIKTYSATVTRVTGVAVQIQYRNRNGTHSQWLNKKLEYNGYPYSSYYAEVKHG